ncbi:IS3 family transposase [Arthrobacter sp. TWP1-1]|uniref:IS3 family transposase n=1 Tax=Arthrobacter sp. TWP1-1 TaxID=2804568 RepID=UPI003CE8094B
MRRPAKSYSFEFKLALVERFLEGEIGLDLAVEAGLSTPELLRKWVRAYRQEGADALRPKPKGRPRRPDAPTQARALIARKADFPLPVLLQVAGLPRSTFFYHQARLQAPDPRDALKVAVTEIFKRNHGRYGHRLLHTELVRQGWTLAKKTVLKLMRLLALVCKVRRKKCYNSFRGEKAPLPPTF